MGSSADADFDSHGAVRAALTRSYNRPPRGSSGPERSAPSQPRTNPPARTIDMMASSAARPLAWVNRVANGRVRTRHRARHPFEKLHFVLFFLNGKARVNVPRRRVPASPPSVRPSISAPIGTDLRVSPIHVSPTAGCRPGAQPPRRPVHPDARPVPLSQRHLQLWPGQQDVRGHQARSEHRARKRRDDAAEQRHQRRPRRLLRIRRRRVQVQIRRRRRRPRTKRGGRIRVQLLGRRSRAVQRRSHRRRRGRRPRRHGRSRAPRRGSQSRRIARVIRGCHG